MKDFEARILKKKDKEDVVILKMPLSAAKTLNKVFSRVGGCPLKTERGTVDKIYDEIATLGIHTDCYENMTGAMYFKNNIPV